MNIPIHRLSAIVFTDIVGYTSLMGEDEEKALHVVQINKNIHEENFRNFHCTYYKQMGDGFLAVFDSAMDAVHASGFILAGCMENKINLRIGIHEGEVVFKENDVYGDEVNIASRIEQSAKSNSIYISESVKRLVDNKSGLKTHFVKEFILKNVKDPVRIYALEVDHGKIAVPTQVKPGTIRSFLEKVKKNRVLLFFILGLFLIFVLYKTMGPFLLPRQGIPVQTRIEIAGRPLAVLPFENLSRNAELDYLGDGFADDIIINLSKIPELTVIARSSSFKYRDLEISLKRISRDLGVENVIEGGFQVANDNIHINIKLIHCNSGNVILAESYDGQLDDIFELQGKVASGITNVLVGTFDKINNQISDRQEINLEALKYNQAGLSLLKENYLSRNTILLSREQFRKAIEEDPSWSAPYVGMAESFIMDIHYGYKMYIQQKDSLEFYTSKAIAIHADPWAIKYLQGLLAFYQFDWAKAKNLLNETRELNPNYPFIYYYQGWMSLRSGDFDEVVSNMDKAISLDPLNEYIRVIRASLISYTGDNEQAIKILSNMLEKDPGESTTLFMLGLIYSNMGQYDKALETLLQRNVGHNTNFMVAYNYAKTGHADKARVILNNLLQLPAENAAPPVQVAIVYLGLDEDEKALEWIQTGYEKYDAWLAFLSQSWFDPVRDDPRFIKIASVFESK